MFIITLFLPVRLRLSTTLQLEYSVYVRAVVQDLTLLKYHVYQQYLRGRI